MRITHFLFLALFLSLSMDVAANETSADQPLQISHSDYVLGGVVGSIVGFGTGHAIQDRYLSGGGWAFTLCEGIGAAAIITGGILYGTAGTDVDKQTLGKRFMLAGGIFYGGFKIWEIIDLWVAPNVTVVGANDQKAFKTPMVGALMRW